MMNPSHGVVLINKEKNYTSHDVVAIVKKTLRTKAGHTGTLDPQAQGVLPVCIGRATKLAGFLTAEDKIYTVEAVLGISTDTLDTEGEITEKKTVFFNEKIIQDTVNSFIGEQEQLPPMYSAVKIKGKKLYDLARKGQTIDRVPRKINIYDIQILHMNPEKNTFTMRVHCSKGAYMRSLCADIGNVLGCGGCMGDLTRVQSGMFVINNAVTLSVFKENPTAYIIPPEKALPYPSAYIKPQGEKIAVNGNKISIDLINFSQNHSEKYWFYLGDVLIGLYAYKNNYYIPEVMMI
jgi:tRNA pseudouridine55 synthase